jgi:signal transduction histidine kinase
VVSYDPASSVDELEAFRAGAHELLRKPITADVVLSDVFLAALARAAPLMEFIDAFSDLGVPARRWLLLAALSRELRDAASAEDAARRATDLLVPSAAEAVIIILGGSSTSSFLLVVAHADPMVGRSLHARLDGRIRAWVEAALADESGHAWCEAIMGFVQREMSAMGAVAGASRTLRVGADEKGLLVLAGDAHRTLAHHDAFAAAVADRLCATLHREQLLRELRQAVDDRDRAISIVSHDLINPLSTIRIAGSALLADQSGISASSKHIVRLIERSADLMQQVVHDLVDRASFKAGNFTLHRMPTLVEPVVDAAHEIFLPLAVEREIVLVCGSAQDVPEVFADPGRLLQVLSNLVANAIKFTSPRGRVHLSVRSMQVHEDGIRKSSPVRVARFAVTDTGPGIEADELPHVFEWFWHSRNAPRGGAGLGLAIARSLVEAHGATLLVESTLGQGTTFWFDLPAIEVDHAPAG